ncbi:MAG TPA: transposase [Streptosporangiaceae bacterium]|nr:transposase [Streptosporangiaceae bacterium]
MLTQLPGVGPFTALVLLGEIGDITRFGSARKLASRVGLTPTVRGSDRTVHHGHISKQGPAWARWVLCEAAQTAKRHPDFAPGYDALARRRGKKIATTAVARKLITRACHLLTDAVGRRRCAQLAGEGRQPRASSQNRMRRPCRAR